MMTTRTVPVAFFAALAVALSTGVAPSAVAPAPLDGTQDEFELFLRNSGVRQRVALPDFLVPTGDEELREAAQAVADVLWDDLDFEREYYLIERETSASVPVRPADQLPFQQWVTLGADFVLAGEARRDGERLVIDLRLIGVRGASQGRQAFGARYPGCRFDQLRTCAHSIADDFHRETRGLEGVALTKIGFISDRDAARVTGRPSQTPGTGKEVYVMDYDGYGQQRMTVNRSVNISPAWSSNGTMMAYTSYLTGFPDIYIANLLEPGRGLQRPAGGTERWHNFTPSFSPDGTRIAFMSNRTGDMDIWVVNVDGTGLRNLSNYPRAADGAPTWSPDGNFIAFTSDRATGGTPQLYVMNANGSGQERLTSVRVDRPTWSPLNFIAFTTGPQTGHDIGLLDMSDRARGVTILTDGIGSNEQPSVAPNGRHIVFTTTRWGRIQAATMDRTGQNVRRLTTAGVNTFPSWQPLDTR